MADLGIDVHKLTKWEKWSLLSAFEGWNVGMSGNQRTRARLESLGLIESREKFVAAKPGILGGDFECVEYRLTPAGVLAKTEIEESDYDKFWTWPGRNKTPVDEYGFPIRDA